VSDNATAPLPNGGDPRTALEPNRVMILGDEEQNALVYALDAYGEDVEFAGAYKRLYKRLSWGDEYANPTDELVHKTFAKRRLEAEIRKLNTRIAELDEQLVEEWAQRGCGGEKHEATGATLRLTRRVYAKLDVDTDGLPKDQADSMRAEYKREVAITLAQFPEFAGIVREDFNLQSLSAIFSERIKEYDETQRALPEHERVPRDPQDFLPDELRGLVVIDATPHVQVRA
jgi:hypothetical protein